MKETAKYTGEPRENFKNIILSVNMVQMGLLDISLLHFSTQSQLNHTQYMLQLMLITSVPAAANSRVSTFSNFEGFHLTEPHNLHFNR
jgi:hypothetical protein